VIEVEAATNRVPTNMAAIQVAALRIFSEVIFTAFIQNTPPSATVHAASNPLCRHVFAASTTGAARSMKLPSGDEPVPLVDEEP
jgi:hypothetical protein